MGESKQVTVRQLRSWAQEVLDSVHLENVRLKTLTADSSDLPLAGPFDVTSEIQFRGMQLQPNAVETATRYVVTCTSNDPAFDDEESRKAWRVECELRATFAANSDESLPAYDSDHLDAFAMIIGVMHIHPYARETVQSTTGRLGYPPFTLDGMMPISARPDDELVEFTPSDDD